MTEKMDSVPNKPKTPTSTFRIPTELKAKVQAKAQAEGRTLTDVLVEALDEYVQADTDVLASEIRQEWYRRYLDYWATKNDDD